jgi:hypothetical protein
MGRGRLSNESDPLDQIRSILASGTTDAEIVGAIRRAVARPPSVQPEVRLNDRNWPVLLTSSAWERHDDPELS